jgi:hypothetical protein
VEFLREACGAGAEFVLYAPAVAHLEVSLER